MKDRLYPTYSGRRWYVVLVYLLMGGSLSPLMAQRNCGSMEYLEDQLKSYPHMRRAIHDIDRSVERKAKSVSGDITVPVVVHVVYHETTQNISEAQIQSQLKVLNQDFRRRNPDRHQTPRDWQPLAADTRINFVLAKVDPQGNPTDGITRTYTPKPTFFPQDNGVKYRVKGGVDAWPTDQYLNIWVCPLGSGMLGYAQFPGGGAKETDGVVISYKHFGTMGTVAPPFDGGRTTTHEVGHWLNLRHIWGDGGCEVDDHVADTPPASGPTHGCATYEESCSGAKMVQNYMDYTDDACMNLFTQGQSARMRALFAPGGFRHAILRSPALQAPSPEPVAPPVVYLAPPRSPKVLTVADRYARLRWEPVAGAESYYVRLRRSGSDQWLSRAFDRPYVNPSQLANCTDYELQVASIVGRDTSEFSRPTVFSTIGCSAPVSTVSQVKGRQPLNLEAMPLSGGQVRLDWDALVGASEYKVQFKQVGRREVTTRYVTQPEIYLTGLRPGARYMFRVRAHFPDRPGPYSAIEEFTYGTMASAGYRRADASERVRIKYYPSHSVLWVRLPVTETQRVDLRLLELDGSTVVQTFPAQTAQPDRSMQLSPDFLTPGRYLLEVTDEEGFAYRERVNLTE